MKKSFILTLLIAATLNFSFAEDGVINSILENKNSAIREIKSFFSGSKVETKEIKLEKTEVKQEDLEIKLEKSPEKMGTDNKIETKSELVKEIKLDTKASTTNNFVCENKSKLFIKRDKISIQIKNQIKDKNKLTDQLLEISSNISTSSKEMIDEKIIKLDTEVGNAIKIQKSIINIIASSTDNICDTLSASSFLLMSDAKSKKINTVENKEYTALNKSIKKLESENEKQLEKINTIIKKDIKNLLVDINKEDLN